jgi:cupin fold WbuC family metalloprotein
METGGTSRSAVEYVTRELIERLCTDASRAPRGRLNHNFHQLSDGYQRLLNLVQPGSYIRPHRHLAPPKSESFVVLQGEIAFFAFDDDGRLRDARRLGPAHDTVAVDIEPGVWHCFAALCADTVVFEGKNGPYDPATDKQFPEWAPAEGERMAAGYLQGLIDQLA